MYNEVVCSVCQNKSIAFDNFLTLHVSVENGGSIISSLKNLFKSEKLSGKNQFHCVKCSRDQDSIKQSYLWRFPLILIIHLKRFITSGYFSKKNNSPVYVNETLNMGGINKKFSANYFLIGSVNHMGSLQGGHYTATCKNMGSQKWYYLNDGLCTD